MLYQDTATARIQLLPKKLTRFYPAHSQLLEFNTKYDDDGKFIHFFCKKRAKKRVLSYPSFAYVGAVIKSLCLAAFLTHPASITNCQQRPINLITVDV